MFKLSSNQIYEHNNDNLDLYNRSSGGDFNITRFILLTHKHSPCMFYSDEKYSDQILDFLFKNAILIKSTVTAKLSYITKNNKNFRGGSFWFYYKNVYVKVAVVGQDDEHFWEETDKDIRKKDYLNKEKTYDLLIAAPSNVQEYPFDDFEPFVKNEKGSKIHLFIKNQYGDYNFEPIKVDLPEDINLELNYGKDFLEVDKQIQERLNSNTTGLYMFHGKPGTGKTTYIKYLASKIDRDFIYIPTTMIESFTSDPNCLSILITKPNSVLILEDAEKAILKRHGDTMDSSNVSSLLNLSDGILSNILKTSVILTYNCTKNEIDSALRRKGRLQADYEFKLLEVENAKKLAKHLKYSKKVMEKIIEPISIADLYNLDKDVDFSETISQEEKERIIGFGKS